MKILHGKGTLTVAAVRSGSEPTPPPLPPTPSTTLLPRLLRLPGLRYLDADLSLPTSPRPPSNPPSSTSSLTSSTPLTSPPPSPPPASTSSSGSQPPPRSPPSSPSPSLCPSPRRRDGSSSSSRGRRLDHGGSVRAREGRHGGGCGSHRVGVRCRQDLYQTVLIFATGSGISIFRVEEVDEGMKILSPIFDYVPTEKVIDYVVVFGAVRKLFCLLQVDGRLSMIGKAVKMIRILGFTGVSGSSTLFF
ncbi:putative fruit protein pKIWI502 [Iris pallida]|uniref:Fruit protein pKIWI502 n=1 Tax=Iris pallida TaxID=29817 RepID=A0AAX6FAV7_IRIPA|nr:putative fruit protein pKIWI502 [Iris pallida]